MTHEEQTKLLAEARWALAQSLRQWSRYANDQRCEPDDVDLPAARMRCRRDESRFYSRAMSALEGLGAVADELERAPLALKTSFASAPGWPSLPWSAETPKRRGWWWWKWDRSEEPLVLAVTSYKEAGHEWFEAQHPFGWLNVETMAFRFPGGRWAGPLSEPESAPDAQTTANDGTQVRAESAPEKH